MIGSKRYCANETVPYYIIGMPQVIPKAGDDDGNKKMQVLYAEDEFTNRKLMEHYLKKLSLDVCVVCDGLQGREAVDSQHFDLILLDLYMPGVDGFTLAQEISKKWPTVPLVAVTSDDDEASRALDFGFSHVLIKPFSYSDIQNLVESVGSKL